MAYISRISAPNLDCAADGDTVFTKSLSLRFVQRAAAAERFYGSTYGRFDTVLATKEATENSQTIKPNSCSWCFAKVLCFVKLHETSAAPSCCILHGRKGCIGCNHNPNKFFYSFYVTKFWTILFFQLKRLMHNLAAYAYDDREHLEKQKRFQAVKSLDYYHLKAFVQFFVLFLELTYFVQLNPT